MAVTVIDTLIIELGLDPKKLTQGQREALQSFKRTTEEAAERAKHLEDTARRVGQVYSNMAREGLKAFGVLAGATGVADFISYIVRTNAAVSRLGQNIGTSAQAISNWSGVVERLGGSAEDAQGSLLRINDQIQRIKSGDLGGDLIPQIRALEALGKPIRFDQSPDKILLDIAEAIHTLAQTDPQLASFRARMITGNEAMANAMLLGRKALQGQLDEMGRMRRVTKEDEEAARALQAAWADLRREATGLGADILRELTPALKDAAADLKDLFGLAQKFNQFFQPVADFINKTKRTLEESGHATNKFLMEGVGGWAKLGSMALGGSAMASTGDAGATGGGTVGRWWTPERQAQAMAYLQKNAGLPEVSARALVARWAGVEAGGGPGSVNPRSGAVGIAQWLGERKAVGVPGDFEGQLAKAVGELKTTEGRAYRTLRGATTEEEAAVGASQFERAEGYNGTSDAFVGKTLQTMRAMRGGGSTTTNSVSIGNITINTQAKDAEGIAKDIRPAIERNSFASQANTGLN